MTRRESKLFNVFLGLLLILLTVDKFELSIQKNKKIQDLKQELVLTKVQAHQKCNERFLGARKLKGSSYFLKL